MKTVDCKFKTVDCKFKTADCKFKTADCKFKTVDCQFKTTDCKFKTADCKFKTADCPTAVTQYLLMLILYLDLRACVWVYWHLQFGFDSTDISRGGFKLRSMVVLSII